MLTGPRSASKTGSSRAQPSSIWRNSSQLELVGAGRSILGNSNGCSLPTVTAHKMSSVTNALLSDDLQDDRPRCIATSSHLPKRRSPLSIDTASFRTHVDDEFALATDICVDEERDENNEDAGNVSDAFRKRQRSSPAQATASSPLHDELEYAMAWNPKQSQWISLAYRYVFAESAFSQPRSQCSRRCERPTASSQSASLTRFTFPLPLRDAMLAAGSIQAPHDPQAALVSSEAEAREACQKLLELMEDEKLMLPVLLSQPGRSSAEPVALASKTEPVQGSTGLNPNPNPAAAHAPGFASKVPPIAVPSGTLRSLHSEWSSLPSSPPPPIFHDMLCNRPIPELRLSPPMSASAKKHSAGQPSAGHALCSESPLTKRMRSSASSSSLA